MVGFMGIPISKSVLFIIRLIVQKGNMLTVLIYINIVSFCWRYVLKKHIITNV